MKSWHPLFEIRIRPVTSMVIVLIGCYMIWFGIVLHTRMGQPLDPRTFRGPLIIGSLSTWGNVYIVLGVVKLLRIFVLQFKWTSRILHYIALVVLTEWAITLDMGHNSLLQPACTLAAIISLMSPLITDIIWRSGEVEFLYETKILGADSDTVTKAKVEARRKSRVS